METTRSPYTSFTAGQRSLLAHFRNILAGPRSRHGVLEGDEALGAPETATPLSTSAVEERVGTAREELHRIVREYLGDGKSLHTLADDAITSGVEGMRAVAENDEQRLATNPDMLAGLEVVVRLDGSRPSFMIRDGAVDQKTSPVSEWGGILDESVGHGLSDALSCVGRIDDQSSPVGFQGTGFLVADDLIVTNRHVLQVIAMPTGTSGSSWTLNPGVCIDFGHEFRARDSVNRRALKRVVFAGPQPITDALDHAKLDLVLVQLAPKSSGVGAAPARPLAVDVSPDWPSSGTLVYVIGYPGNPELAVYPMSVLEQLFQTTYGCKRLAPGAVVSPFDSVAQWTVTHDSTTLGGNSGSVLLVIGREQSAAGLHYGGRRLDPRENWGHVLGRVLDTHGQGARAETVRKVMQRYGVSLTDRATRDQAPRSATRPESVSPAVRIVTADLRRTAKLELMVRPSDEMRQGTLLERAGHEPTTPAEELSNRNGYDENFLRGWKIGFPAATGQANADVLLSRGGQRELTYTHFSVMLSKSRRMPMLTAVNINGEEARSIKRVDTPWAFDGRLLPNEQWGDALYDNNALDRGHMVRREDPVWGSEEQAQQANVDTFHFTNSCPQMAGVNQKTWLGLENYILRHARADGMRVTVFTGPFFTGDDLEYRNALVPLAFWKVVAIVRDDGRPSATAYRVSQERELSELEYVYAGYKTYQISVQQVMEATGIDFSALVDYDGFSAHERQSGTPMAERIDHLEQVRV